MIYYPFRAGYNLIGFAPFVEIYAQEFYYAPTDKLLKLLARNRNFDDPNDVIIFTICMWELAFRAYLP